MTWKEKKAELLLAHRLEKKRILLTRSLAFLTVIAAAVAAYFIAPIFAAYFKEQELVKQAELELKLQRQNVYYAERFKAYRGVDAAMDDLYYTYRGAILHFKIRGATAQVDSASVLLGRKFGNVMDSLHHYLVFLDPIYASEAQKQAMLYKGVMPLERDNWFIFESFFHFLRMQLLNFESSEFQSFLKDSSSNEWGEPFILSDYIAPSAISTDGDERDIKYLKSNFEAWASHADTIKSVQGKTKK